MSQLSIIRAAISAFLQAHGATVGGDILADSRNLRENPREVAPIAEQGPVPDPVPWDWAWA